jgi:hypothetical protein
MTKKQIAFCRAYFENPVGADAARRAGYSEKTARQIAYKIKHKSKVDLDVLYQAYMLLTVPFWAKPAAREAFFKKAVLPDWFIEDMNNGRYKPQV